MNYHDDDSTLTRRERRNLRKKKGIIIPAPKNNGLRLRNIQPKTENQSHIFSAYNDGSHVLSYGYAGTGKTFLFMFLSLQELLDGDGQYNKIIIVRSVVPTRAMGFLPGDEKKKSEVYEAPYMDICNELFSRGDAYSILKQNNKIEFTTTSFLRGTTFRDAIVIVDEAQNMNDGEFGTVITRMGENTRLMISGDYRQNDLAKSRTEESYMPQLIKIIGRMDLFESVEMGIDDIVRGPLVKQWIIAKESLGL